MLRLDTENSLIPQSEIDALLSANAQAFECCFSAFPMTGWLDLTSDELMSEIGNAVNDMTEMENFVVCGIGGSALGAKAVHTALNGFYPPLKPRIFIEDNIDPFRVRQLLDVVDIKKTVFNFVSKSGGTMETLAQLLLIVEKLREKKLELNNHIIITVGNENSDLYRFAKKHGIKIFCIPETVGGRFSVFTPAGLLPLKAAHNDIQNIIAGAREQKEKTLKKANSPAAIFAAVNYLAAKRGKNILVLMPYIDSFRHISDWFCQLWAESLGKGGKGQTPIPAVGTTDQHSLLQLLMEGPDDKTVVFLDLESYDYTPPLNTGKSLESEGADFKFFSGKNFADLQKAALEGTRQALTDAKRSNITITLPAVSGEYIGELLMFFMLATAFSGVLYGVNPYDQPGVEAGKKITKKIIEKLK